MPDPEQSGDPGTPAPSGEPGTSIEVHFDRGYGDKSLVIESRPIVGDLNDPADLVRICQPGVLLFAANGMFAAPFAKGSRVLKELRNSTGLPFDQWELVVPLPERPDSLFRILNEAPADLAGRDGWGVWTCRARRGEPAGQSFPDLVVVNFPLFHLRRQWEQHGCDPELLKTGLSSLYRATVSALEALRTFSFSQWHTLLMSDLGGGMLGSEPELQPLRIKVLGEVMGAWLAGAVDPSRVVVAYGGSVNQDVLAKAWAAQASAGKDDQAEFGEALRLRVDNAEFCKRLALLVERSGLAARELPQLLRQAAEAFASPTISLVPDLVQCRVLAEGLALELVRRQGAKSAEANLMAYIERLEKTKRVSPWITSYLHVLRLLGNEAAHFKSYEQRRPERPVGRDLVVVHAVLNRILDFCHGEFSRKP